MKTELLDALGTGTVDQRMNKFVEDKSGVRGVYRRGTIFFAKNEESQAEYQVGHLAWGRNSLGNVGLYLSESTKDEEKRHRIPSSSIIHG